ncbi:MAG: hypothetical protein D6768_18990 [Chloroflexi bacterium]|nr:MAG: hypothetical protein D6768_18990 [Chloroflexota bacterium]
MTETTLFSECPKCSQAPVTRQANGLYCCQNCGVTLKEYAVLGLFKKGRYTIESLGEGDYSLAGNLRSGDALPPDALKVVLGNVYTDGELAGIAAGNLDVIRPVSSVLAQIILEQLREECYININGLRRGHGAPLPEQSSYHPSGPVPTRGIKWQDEGNLFCTTQRLVLPSNQFTFIRLGRKISAVQAYTNGVAVQQKGEEFATYFVGCYPHEAALVAAYVMGKIPKLRPAPDAG